MRNDLISILLTTKRRYLSNYVLFVSQPSSSSTPDQKEPRPQAYGNTHPNKPGPQGTPKPVKTPPTGEREGNASPEPPPQQPRPPYRQGGHRANFSGRLGPEGTETAPPSPSPRARRPLPPLSRPRRTYTAPLRKPLRTASAAR